MACYHPMRAIKIGNEENGKPKYKIDKWRTKTWYDAHPEDWIEIPCGKCIGCRLAYSRQWANRCMLEAKNWENNVFLTLTYDNEHLTTNTVVDQETGEICEVGTLAPNELTKFMKDLRRYYKYHYNHENIRFYACGEYGDENKRPHFHLILFNLPVYDMVFSHYNQAHQPIYTSETIYNIWGKKGLIGIGEVNWDTCAYVARYIMKKQKGKDGIPSCPAATIEKEFVRMSRAEGIGRAYYEENKHKIYKNDEIIITDGKGRAQTIKPSKYYDKLYDLEEPDKMVEIKAKRVELAAENTKLEMSRTDKTREEYLETKERNKEAQIKTLKRVI